MRDLRFLLKTHYTRSRALVIGIDRYKNISPLEYAVSDASEFRQTLIDSLKFESDDITFLINEAATRDAIFKAFLRFSHEDIDVDERLIIFYAGHGSTQTGLRGEIGYLVPHDAVQKDFSTFIRWDDFTKNSELVRAKHVLFIMDACYGGLALTRSIGPGGARFLKDMMLRYSRQVLTAGKADEVVADSGGPLPNHSVFTGHLLEGMRGKAAAEHGVITASGLMAYVYNRVATDKNSDQTPHYGHFDGDGDLILVAPGLSALETSEMRDDDRLVSIPFALEEPAEEGTFEKVKLAKKLLSSDFSSIELHDLLAHEVRRFLSLTSEDTFPTSVHFSNEEMFDRISRYEDAVLDLSLLLACVSHWGKTIHFSTIQKFIARSSDRLESNSGLSVWLNLRWYPLILNIYTAGIAAIDAQRFDTLATIFYAQFPSEKDRDHIYTFAEYIAKKISALNSDNTFKKLPGHERQYVPHSEYLFKILQPRLDDTFFLGKNYETAFDEFEVFFALAVADIRMEKKETVWGPFGRFGWKHKLSSNGPLVKIINDANKLQGSWPPLKAGMFGGDFGRFHKVASEYLQLVEGLSWF
ncbi:caspase family protein [Desulfomicrobium sp. ZS1]|uniref:caspase family protein n=1 Tax=Desulfomicrobium sp. ZS1 TaxID=2952228 RepID=UPI0020B26935|nr:caspase family protein [Desulfomicrobium sp. ZS1]UTF51454.1 caspase family protein [Desulfomicrobium sp. ZS1]